MNNKVYTIKKGEKFPILIKLKNFDEDAPIDLSNSTIRIIFKDELTDCFNTLEKTITETSDIEKDGKIISPTEGQVVFKLNDNDYKQFIVERVYYMTIIWDKPNENFSKVISSNGQEYLKFIVCHP